MHIFEKEFDFVIQRAKALDRPARMVVAGADCENIVKAVFEAEAQGFARPVLVGNEDKIKAMLKKLGLYERNYVISAVSDYEINTDYHVYMKRAIDIINDGLGDVLVRGNTSTRNFLMPILDKKHNLTDGLVSEVALIKVPYYDKVLALVEKPSFHMRDTVEAQNIVRAHKMDPIADCELVGPIPWDLIVSKEAARLKNYDCPYCGEFDAVLMPNVMAGNTVMKVLSMSANVNACGVLAGTKVPVAIASRSSSEEQAYLSLCVAAAMLYEDKK